MTLLPPLNGVLTPISPLPQAVISSYLEATKKEGKKTQCLLLALILFLLFFPVQHCIHTWSLQGHKDAKRKKKNERSWDRMVCPQKKRNNYNVVKTIKRNLEQNCKHIGIKWRDYILQFHALWLRCFKISGEINARISQCINKPELIWHYSNDNRRTQYKLSKAEPKKNTFSS